MEVRCQSCSTKLKAREEHLGRKVKCPKCSATVLIPDPNVPEELVDFVDDDDAPPVRPTVIRKRDSKQPCPMCGALNPRSATECDSCGEELSSGPHQSQRGDRHEVWRSGKILVMHKESKLPNRCVKTNGPADHWLKRKLSWHHPAIFLTILAGALIYIILAVVTSKSATIHIGLCDAALRRRRYAILFGWLAGLSSLGIMGGAITTYSATDPGLFILLFVGGLVFGLVGIIWASKVASCVSPSKIDKEYVWLRGVHLDYLNELPDWDGID